MVFVLRRKKLLILFVLFLLAVFSFIILPWVWKVFYPFPYQNTIVDSAQRSNLSPNLVLAVIRVESKFRADAKSPRGACGLMQLMPETAKWVTKKMGISYAEEKLFDPEFNIKVGSWYLAYLISEFNGNVPAALAAYNGGRGNVRQWLDKGIWLGSTEDIDKIPFKETRQFIERVLHDYNVYSCLY
ncbi:lytic transglycosylase domain-containing protein [Bacillota bacterium LX-D]|nr:lytic transglycosylase domain-containing protein [Bacillota bacterium LX-D]